VDEQTFLISYAQPIELVESVRVLDVLWTCRCCRRMRRPALLGSRTTPACGWRAAGSGKTPRIARNADGSQRRTKRLHDVQHFKQWRNPVGRRCHRPPPIKILGPNVSECTPICLQIKFSLPFAPPHIPVINLDWRRCRLFNELFTTVQGPRGRTSRPNAESRGEVLGHRGSEALPHRLVDGLGVPKAARRHPATNTFLLDVRHFRK